MKALFLALLLAISCIPAFAQPAAVIEGVQTPAWLERGGDGIVSGKDARIVVKLSEGSVVKLGENGTLHLAELQPSRELFKTALGRRLEVNVGVEQAVTMD